MKCLCGRKVFNSMVLNYGCLHQFITSYDSKQSPEEISKRMSVSLIDQVIEADNYHIYERSTNGKTDLLSAKTKPTKLFCDLIQYVNVMIK